jgi:hypothetical protein
MSDENQLSLEELRLLCQDMEHQSPERLRQIQERLMASMPPETQVLFRRNEATAKTRLPRPRLMEISLESLRALTRDDLDMAVYEYVEAQLDNAEDRCAALLLLPRGLQVFYLSFIVEVEVMNGGLDQFFWNQPTELAELIPPALRRLNADEAATIFEQAMLIADEELYKRAALKEDGSLDAFSKSRTETNLKKFDATFADNATKFPELRSLFIQSHEHEFISSKN